MKSLSIAAILAVAVICTSCKSGGGGGKKTPAVPESVQAMAERARAQARACLVKKGVGVAVSPSYRVVLVTGTKHYPPHGWAFESKAHGGRHVMAHTSATTKSAVITIAHAPGNPAAVSEKVMVHEFGHYWLLANGRHQPQHPPAMSSCFWNWRDLAASSSAASSDTVVDFADEIAEDQR